MTDMNCDGCEVKARCCVDNGVQLFKHEFETLKIKLVEVHATITSIGNQLFFIQRPCPLFLNGKCSVYNNRPIACRVYPFYFLRSNGIIKFALTHECCRASQFTNDEKRKAFKLAMHIKQMTENAIQVISKKPKLLQALMLFKKKHEDYYNGLPGYLVETWDLPVKFE